MIHPSRIVGLNDAPIDRGVETILHVANVGWIFGLHERPWGSRRLIFGRVRYMNRAGLMRKFDMDVYVAKVDALAYNPGQCPPD
jgi:hypothetical protein